MARYGAQTILHKDLNGIVGTALIIAAFLPPVNMLIDVIVGFIDPRVRLGVRATNDRARRYSSRALAQFSRSPFSIAGLRIVRRLRDHRHLRSVHRTFPAPCRLLRRFRQCQSSRQTGSTCLAPTSLAATSSAESCSVTEFPSRLASSCSPSLRLWASVLASSPAISADGSETLIMRVTDVFLSVPPAGARSRHSRRLRADAHQFRHCDFGDVVALVYAAAYNLTDRCAARATWSRPKSSAHRRRISSSARSCRTACRPSSRR